MNMCKFLTKFCGLLTIFLVCDSYAANWYLDAAAGGSGNGTSWSNAWEDPSQVVWGANGVKAGDTLFISGGTDTKTYSSALVINASGVEGLPIRIRVGQDPGHNGAAILPGISYNSEQFIVVDGSRDPNFEKPKSVWNIEQIKTNLGIRLTRPDGLGVFVNGDGGMNNSFRWVEVGPIGTSENVGRIHGIRFLNLTSLYNWKIEYCWFHDIQNDAINHNATENNPEYFDALTIRWSLIERTGDDGIQTSSNGITIENCFLRDHWDGLYNGHPDQIQFAGASMRYFKIVNNVIRNKANSLIIAEHLVTENGQLGPMLIAGNIFYNTRDWVFKEIQAYGSTFNAWRPNNDVSVAKATWTGFYLLNNTFYYQRTIPFKVGRAKPDGSTRSVWELIIEDSAVRNNLMVDCRYNTDKDGAMIISGDGELGSGTNGVYYTTSDFPFTHNIITGPNKSAIYDDVIYSDVASAGNSNSSTMPSLISTNDYDLRLMESDTVALNKGASLSYLTNQFPELMVDLWGNPRGYDEAWDIGANEYSSGSSAPPPDDGSNDNSITDGLVLSLQFNDSLLDGIVHDSSGLENHGYRFGHESSPTNWPSAASYTHPVTQDVGTSARFRWYPRDGWGNYSTSGDYVGITNVNNGLQNMTKSTVMLWVKRDPGPDIDGDGLIEWHECQGRYICSGYGYSGAWTIGMFTDRGAPYSYVRVYTNNSAFADSYVWFGEGSRVETKGNVTEGSLPWTHFAFTWDEGVLKTYLNGVFVKSANLPINELTSRGPSGTLGKAWVALGCDTHNGNPWLTPFDDSGDQYPNHAWFNGEMDDVRIYNRVLSASEIQSVYDGTEGSDGNQATAPAVPSGFRLLSNE